MRPRPPEFESLAEVIKRLELAKFTAHGARSAVCDILNDRRYLKRLHWADMASGVIVNRQIVRRLNIPTPNDINFETSSVKKPRLNNLGQVVAKIEIRISDITWYLSWRDLSPDVSAATSADERAAIKALAHYLPSDPDMKRDDAEEWCRSNGYQLSHNGFRFRVWPQARVGAGLRPIALPGRKPKTSRPP
jgi:hypothetical protein